VDGQWYGGHSTPGTASWRRRGRGAGLWVTGALTIVVSAVLFERLVADRFGAGTAGALWFAVASRPACSPAG